MALRKIKGLFGGGGFVSAGERGPFQSSPRLEVVQQGPEEIAVGRPGDAEGAEGEKHVREHRCVCKQSSVLSIIEH